MLQINSPNWAIQLRPLPNIKADTGPGIVAELLNYLELSETDKSWEGAICHDLSYGWKPQKGIKL